MMKAQTLKLNALVLMIALMQPINATKPTINPKARYIVLTEHSEMPSVYQSPKEWYQSSLKAALTVDQRLTVDETEPDMAHPLLHLYDTAVRGFATELSELEVELLEEEAPEGFLAVIPDKLYKTQTTYTPRFLGLSSASGLWPVSGYGEDVIVGVLDTGIWPESKSFDDYGYGDVPERWKGSCVDAGIDFNSSLCNKKLIGARYFYSEASGETMAMASFNITEPPSPRDYIGHGTHTASTIVGSFVGNASAFGYASGTASGIAPKARIAAYKICWQSRGGCLASDVLAAMDAAISDGVDVISLSLGEEAVPFYKDPIAIAAFAATIRYNIVVVAAGGNSGPTPGSVVNTAPWLLTVAASTVDRDFPALVQLGNGDFYVGQSLYGGKGLGESQFRLVSAGQCDQGSLAEGSINGSVVLCQQSLRPGRPSPSSAYITGGGGVGEILIQRPKLGSTLLANSFILPGLTVSVNQGNMISDYAKPTTSNKTMQNRGNGSVNANATLSPTVSLSFNGTRFRKQAAPVVASFSGHGPNAVVPEILKPDIAAPGVNILAAWSPLGPPTRDPSDDRSIDFNIVSGTSMATPHVAGVVALLKAAQPSWSPAAIKSALMTSAAIPSWGDALGYGAGHVHPNAAMYPSLVYDISVDGYIDFICNLSYSARQLRLFAIVLGYKDLNCSNSFKSIGAQSIQSQHLSNLNYPSISLVLERNSSMNLTRSLTNVGREASIIFKAVVIPPNGTSIEVVPPILSFSKYKDEKSFKVVVSDNRATTNDTHSFGWLIWQDLGQHFNVTSPIVVFFQ